MCQYANGSVQTRCGYSPLQSSPFSGICMASCMCSTLAEENKKTYIYIYIYMYIYIYIYIYYVSVRIYVFILTFHIYIYISICICICIYKNKKEKIYTNTYIHLLRKVEPSPVSLRQETQEAERKQEAAAQKTEGSLCWCGI